MYLTWFPGVSVLAVELVCTLLNVEDDGLRPRRDGDKRAVQCGECLKLCPGIAITATATYAHPGAIPELHRSWGNVLPI